jgi:hypothetical protein
LNIWETEVEGCGLHKEEKWRGLCTCLPFFFLETEQEGEGNSRRGWPAMGVGPLVHGNSRGEGENGEEAEGVQFRPSSHAETVYGGLSMEMGGGRQW